MWIRISETVILNSDKISAIETRKIRGKLSLTFIAEGKSYICELDPQDVLGDLIKAGINMDKQFFAG